MTSSSSSSSSSTPPHADPIAWKIIHEFATTNMSRPNAEIRLQAHLGNSYSAADWEPALKVITEEEDADEAINTIASLEKAALCCSGLKIRIPSRPRQPHQLISAETELMQTIDNLKSRNRIFGVPPTVDELLDPAEEREVEDSPFDSQDPVKAVADVVRHEIAIADGRVMEIESDDDDDSDDNSAASITRAELSALCQRIETACLQYGNPQVALHLSELLCNYRGQLRREELQNAKQTFLDQYFTK